MVYLRGVYVESEKFHFFPEERILSKSFWRAPHEKATVIPLRGVFELIIWESLRVGTISPMSRDHNLFVR